jgi:uncharacterized membrane protein
VDLTDEATSMRLLTLEYLGGLIAGLGLGIITVTFLPRELFLEARWYPVMHILPWFLIAGGIYLARFGRAKRKAGTSDSLAEIRRSID